MTRKLKPKAVILDFDDCLCDFIGMLCRIHNKINKTYITPSDILEYDMNKAHMVDVQGNEVNGEDLFNTFKEYEQHGLYATLKPLPEARHALHIIRNLGYRIIILTARPEEYKKQTKFCLLHQNLEHDEVIFAPSKEKAKTIRRLSKTYNIVAFADDKASTCIDVNESTKVKQVYIINQSHNKDIEIDEEIKRVDSVFDIVRNLPDLTEVK